LTQTEINPSNNNSQLQPAVELEGISKLFGRFAALHDLTATFSPARLYALVGENGAGKTTLLRIIAGLARPTRGGVRVLGRAPRLVSGRIGYMAHSSLLYDDLTACENLDYFRGLYAGNAKKSSQELLEIVGLDTIDPRRHVSQYSQGMKQRLALARSLLASPELLLLDEPFSNVDSKSISAMSLLLGRLRDEGTTLMVITHQIEVLSGIADEWITMHAGTIVRRESALRGSGAVTQGAQR
jgi:ABC-type multidrug transport system ATPase subunit